MFYFISLYFRLENKESHKSQEIGNLIRVYNRSKREEAESEPLNLYVEDEKGNLLAGLIAETFGNWLEIEYLFVKEELRGQGIGSKLLQQQKVKLRIEIVVLPLSILTSSRHRTFIRNIATRKFFLCKTISTLGKDIITKRICKVSMEVD
ncbi:acetyltransferase [Streptococcus pneumoniae]|nr:acetyltransferase [Streptococcus pneumoniae]VIV90265.1 acetyltransferase [Streptococcus pneumoniae]